MCCHSTVGKENTFGTIVGRVAPGPFSFCRVSTDDNDPVERLLQYICRHGLEHHVAATRARVADALEDALGTYLGWEVYYHH